MGTTHIVAPAEISSDMWPTYAAFSDGPTALSKSFASAGGTRRSRSGRNDSSGYVTAVGQEYAAGEVRGTVGKWSSILQSDLTLPGLGLPSWYRQLVLYPYTGRYYNTQPGY